MSIRITLLTLLVVGLAVYAWRDWFVALCGLILLMAVIEHPDMPKNIAGIQGLNPWNALMASIVLAWLAQRRAEGLVWDMPRHVTAMLLAYLGVVVIGVVRMLGDRSYIEHLSTSYLVSEHFINTVKWVVPSLLLFDGCRSRFRLKIATASILTLYLLLAVQVIKYIPASAAMSGDSMNRVAMKICSNDIGYHRVNLSMLLAGASWAMLATLPMTRARWQKVLVFAAFAMTSYAQALTGGRMGYVTWGVLGLVLCVLRWRKLLLVAPLVPAVVAMAMPGVAERMMQGFGLTSVSGETMIAEEEVTSDRTLIWPVVIEEILQSPVLGYGRLAMVRTGLAAEHEEITFPHPHNAYLEWLLDNGLVGFVLVMPFYAMTLFCAVALFLDRADPLCSLVGGIATALVLALLVASMGSQTFYPREGAVGMWAAIAIMLRVRVERLRAQEYAGCSSPQPVRIQTGQITGQSSAAL